MCLRRRPILRIHASAASDHRPRDFGNRGGCLVADLVGVDDRHPRHQWYSSGMSLIASGGQVADIEIGAFLIAAGNGPEK